MEAAERHSPPFVSPGYEDDKVQLPFTVTDLKGQSLQLVTGPHDGQVRVDVCTSVAVDLDTLAYLSGFLTLSAVTEINSHSFQSTALVLKTLVVHNHNV